MDVIDKSRIRIKHYGENTVGASDEKICTWRN